MQKGGRRSCMWGGKLFVLLAAPGLPHNPRWPGQFWRSHSLDWIVAARSGASKKFASEVEMHASGAQTGNAASRRRQATKSLTQAAQHTARPGKPLSRRRLLGRAARPASAAPVAALCGTSAADGRAPGIRPHLHNEPEMPPLSPGWARGARGGISFPVRCTGTAGFFIGQQPHPPRPAPRRGARKQLREACVLTTTERE